MTAHFLMVKGLHIPSQARVGTGILSDSHSAMSQNMSNPCVCMDVYIGVWHTVPCLRTCVIHVCVWMFVCVDVYIGMCVCVCV